MMNAELNISTHPQGPIVSFHPLIRGDANFWSFTAVSEEVWCALAQARVAIFPQVFPEPLYHLARGLLPFVFPNYESRFRFRGKGGQFLMFRALKLPCPQSIWLPQIASLGPHPGAVSLDLFSFPFVLKTDDEHEGQGVFLIEDEVSWQRGLSYLKERERQGRKGFLIQEYLPSPFDLRVVVFGKEKFPIWRKTGKSFRSNLSQGGEVIPCPDKFLERKALAKVEELQAQTGIDLAALDFLFREGTPLFNEINYVFGRRALGGRFEELLFKAVRAFLKSIPG